jgi:hypothetical protein
MKKPKCRKCDCFQKNNFKGMSLEYKLLGVRGFCIDSSNPDFNWFAKTCGRGVGWMGWLSSPKWCAKRENPVYVDMMKGKSWVDCLPYSDDFTTEEIDDYIKNKCR